MTSRKGHRATSIAAAEDSEISTLTVAQVEELETRLQFHEQDADNAIAWEQVRAELLQRNE